MFDFVTRRRLIFGLVALLFVAISVYRYKKRVPTRRRGVGTLREWVQAVSGKMAVRLRVFTSPGLRPAPPEGDRLRAGHFRVVRPNVRVYGRGRSQFRLEGRGM